MQRLQINHHSISTAWSSQLVSPLPPAPWLLTSWRNNEIHDVLERYAQYIQSYVKSCRCCINKRHSQKYGHVPPKLVIRTPWQALCVALLGPYTLIGKGGKSIDFMCLTMIDPWTSWFEIVELLTVTKLTVPNMDKGIKVTCNDYTKESDRTFDKSPAQISNLVYTTWFSRYLRC